MAFSPPVRVIIAQWGTIPPVENHGAGFLKKNAAMMAMTPRGKEI
jgi:hypothetical protein